MAIITGLPAAQLQFCLHALRVGAVQLQLAVAQLPRAPPSGAQTKPYSTHWLPRSVNKWLKKQQRGQDIYPATALQLGTVTPLRHIPPNISRPHYAVATPSSAVSGPGLSKQPEIQSDEASRSAMRAAGRLAAQALKLAGSMAVPGTTTDGIDLAVHDFLINHGAYPSPLMYHGFPKSVCTSVNEVVCHGGCQCVLRPALGTGKIQPVTINTRIEFSPANHWIVLRGTHRPPERLQDSLQSSAGTPYRCVTVSYNDHTHGLCITDCSVSVGLTVTITQ